MIVEPSVQQPVADQAGPDWPINEIMLQSLVLAGKHDSEIAALFHVEPDRVTRLREEFGL